MKKSYSAPYAEKINFNYKEQVVASNDGGKKGSCHYQTLGTHSAVGCRDNADGESVLVG